MNGIVLDTCAGPGGWTVGLGMLGIHDVGIELDAAACATRAAAGHKTIRADISRYPVHQLAGKTWGQVHSPPCTTFSMAGKRAGTAVTDILAQSTRDAFAGRKTRALRRREMARVLRAAWWPSPKLTRAQRSAKIWAAVRSASLVTEPARYIVAGQPEWVALEQVPAVLPLWQVYAEELAKLGYHTWCGKLNAADYGVPQTRERAILIASRTRKVYRPEPTHYDPRKGDQLWGTPWVSMAEALGWGMDQRPYFAICTAGGLRGGADEQVGGSGARKALYAERDAGRWILHTNRGQAADGSRQTADPRSAPPPAPAPALTSKSGGQWFLRKDAQANAAMRPAPAPAPTISFGHASGEMRWVFRNNNNNACVREMDEPAGTLFFSNRSNWAAWVQERPSTTLQGDPRVFPPHAGSKGEHQSTDSVRITVQEAAVLQSFPPDYPFQGTKTAQFRQVGDAVPPLLAMHVVAMATGIKIQQSVAA